MLPCNQSHDSVPSGACHVMLPFRRHQEQDVLLGTPPREKPEGAACTQMESLTHTAEEEVCSHFHRHWWQETTKYPIFCTQHQDKELHQKAPNKQLRAVDHSVET